MKNVAIGKDTKICVLSLHIIKKNRKQENNRKK